MPKTDAKPEQLHAEPSKIFRLRAVLWIVQNYPDLTFDGIRDKYVELYGSTDIPMSKESIVRDMHVLEQRRQVSSYSDPNDARRLLWEPL